MSITWDKGPDDAPPDLGLGGILRLVFRGLAVLAVLLLGVVLMLALRLIERPLCGARRPITPHITVWACRGSLFFLGLKIRRKGKMMTQPGGLVANHAAWLDIMTLNSGGPLYFVSKSSVAKWPGIGFLASITGTVFIARAAHEAGKQKQLFDQRLSYGHRLLFFPEGTSTDGLRVLPFRSSLFEAYFGKGLFLQPITVIYHAPKGQPDHFYGWWGDMPFGTHLLKTLCCRGQGSVDMIYHPPVAVDDFANRKLLAASLEETVRSAMPQARQLRG